MRKSPTALALALTATLLCAGPAVATPANTPAAPAATAPEAVAFSTRLPQAMQRQAPSLLRILIKLSHETVPDESGSQPPDQVPGDPALLPLALPALDDRVASLIDGAPGELQPPLQDARAYFSRARAEMRAGSPDTRPDFMVTTLQTMVLGEGALGQALDLAQQIDPSQIPLILPAINAAREAASHTSQGLIDLAIAGGVSAGRIAPAQDAQARGDADFAAGDYQQAVAEYANAFGLAANTVTFSVNHFEQNLRSVFDSETVGYAYAISTGGVLASAGANGQARTGADPPVRLQSSTRKMHVASVTKTLTAIVTLRLLADRGLTADEPIGPWLPSDWARGTGVDALRFSDLMTHHSGFDQNDVAGSNYDALRDVIAKPVGDTSYAYNNANFGMLRVLDAGLAGIDAAKYPGIDPGVFTASVFLFASQLLYSGIGVAYTCEPQPLNQTIEYLYPDNGEPGFVEPSNSLTCGGYGAFVSAQELANVLVHLRYTSELLDASTRQQMFDGYLGLDDPMHDDFAEGVFGEYLSHGGDWDHGNGGLDSCVMMFPITIEATLTINSSGENSGTGYSHGYQCAVIKWAFEHAWVAP